MTAQYKTRVKLEILALVQSKELPPSAKMGKLGLVTNWPLFVTAWPLFR